MRLVGRDTELDTVRDQVKRLAAGQGRSVWMAGEPGVGKTALLTAGLAGAAEQGCRVLRAQADQAGTRLPLRLLLDGLGITASTADPDRRPIADLLFRPDTSIGSPDQPAAPAASELLVDLVQRWCARSPVVLAADDLQWADELSLAVWRRLQQLTSQLPLLLIATTRPVPQRDQLAPLRDRSDLLLDLAPLAPAAVTALTSDLLGASPGPRLVRLAAQVGGNPLYLEELLATLTREERVRTAAGVAELAGPDPAVPASLAAAIHRRLGFVSEPALGALRLAALLGPEFTVTQLAQVSGKQASELLPLIDESTVARLLVPAGAGSEPALSFRHGLIRQALVDGIPVTMRRALHLQAAGALAAAGAPPEQVAGQVLAAGPESMQPSWLVDWLLRAAAPLTFRATDDALALLRRVRQQPGLSQELRDQLDVHLANALFLVGDYQQVEQVATPVLDRLRDPVLAGRLAWALGHALIRLQHHDRATSVLGRLLADGAQQSVWRNRLYGLRALGLVASNRLDEASDVATRAEQAGRRDGDSLAVGYARHIQSLVELNRQAYLPALSLVDQALAEVGDHPDGVDLRLLLLRNRLILLASLGMVEEADRVLGETLTLAERSGSPARHGRSRIGMAEAGFLRGRWDDTLAELEVAAELSLDAVQALRRQGLAALIALHRDDQSTLDRLLAQPEPPSPPPGQFRYFGHYLRIARALAAERDNQPGEALAMLRAVFAPDLAGGFAELPADAGPIWLPGMARLAGLTGQPAQLEAAVRIGEQHARYRPLPMNTAVVNHCRGLRDADPAAVSAAAGTYQQLHLPLFQGQALADVAVLHARAGDTGAARPAYTQAVDIFTRLGAAWDLRRVDTWLRPYGIRRGVRGPRQRPSSGWEALTATELTVADLVAEGLSNPDIATKLHLSRRTVETHVSHILTKLDATSRVDIAREVAHRSTGRP